jgi:hypothetical protein
MSYPAPPPPPPDGGYGGYGGYAQPQTNKKAIWSLVTGILSLLCCGIVAGIPALILGSSAKREIQASGGSQTGLGMAKAGVVLGIISLALTVLYLIGLVAGIVPTPTFSTSTSTSP